MESRQSTSKGSSPGTDAALNSTEADIPPSEHVVPVKPVPRRWPTTSSPQNGGSSTTGSPTTKGARRATKAAAACDDAPEDDSMSRCLVYARLRPSTKRDFQDGATKIVALPDGHRVIMKDERCYDFDGTFGPKATQEDLFSAVAVPCIQHAFNGFCSALMCYGQTGTGKSFTMCNLDPANEGIIPRAARFIFNAVANPELANGRQYRVVGQFVQIYRDQLGDLMVHDGKDRVDIHYDPQDGVSLSGCTSHRLANEQAFLRFYHEGNARRVVTATAMNPESSRGHTAMIIYIASENPDDPSTGRLKGKITFIDLAGYERFSKTGITSDNPIMKDEAKTINASLLALGGVVSALSSGGKHIPWRNSKLTRILQDSIGGRSRTSIILTIGPSSDHLYETTNSLQFGLRAMAVKVRAKASVTVNYEKLATKLMSLLSERDARITALELQIANRDEERQELLGRYEADRAELEARFERELGRLTSAGAGEAQIGKLKEVYHAEVRNLQDQQAEELGYQDEVYSKEITQLINEQKHQEAKSVTAMRLAQESIVEEFQRKLESARVGGNDDLVRALQQLTEKDSVIASRASDTARLHAHIAVLTEQVRGLGAEPAEPERGFQGTYLDVAQVEEMKGRLEGDVGRLRNKLVDVQTQLDRVTLICSDRNEQISGLSDENDQLRGQLMQTGAEMKDSTEELERLQERRAEVVDQSELETLRLRMQSDLDELKSERTALQAALEKAREESSSRSPANSSRRRRGGRSHQQGGGGDSADKGSPTADFSGSTPNFPDNVSESSSSVLPGCRSAAHSKTNQMRNVYKRQVKRLTFQLARSCADRECRLQRICELEALLAERGIPCEPFAVPVKVEDPGYADPDVAILLAMRDAEADAMERILLDQERLLNQGKRSLDYSRQLVATLTAQLQQAGLAPQDPDGAALQPFETLSVDEYAALLRDLRAGSRRLMLQLLLRASDPADDGRDTSTAAARYAEELEERDSQLELKDELLLDKAAVAQYMAKISGRLISQMEALGLTPCCAVPECYQETAVAEVEQLAVQSEMQRELEVRLRRQEEERGRMNRLLNALSADREHQSLVLRQAEGRNRELEERQGRAAKTISRLAEEKTQRELILEDSINHLTRELMDTQARLARSEADRRASVFDKLFGRTAD